MKAAAVLLMAISIAPIVERFKRDTNSHAATERGIKAFAGQQFKPAIDEFTTANAIKPSPSGSFNLGTSQIAAGKREDGSVTLENAMSDPTLRADAFYNRGNSALTAKAWDYAIKDYEDALRIRPADLDAKRNLEIALSHKMQEEKKKDQQGSAGGRGGKGDESKNQKAENGGQPKLSENKGAPDKQPGQNGDKDGKGEGKKTPDQIGAQGPKPGEKPGTDGQSPGIEALLRAIQQQESEALQQMKRARAQGRKVGW